MIERYSSMVYKIAFTKTRTRHDAETSSEVFLRYIARQAFDSRSTAWLTRDAQLRKQAAVVLVFPNRAAGRNLHTPTRACSDDERDLWRAVKNLPDNTNGRLSFLAKHDDRADCQDPCKARATSASAERARKS